MHIRAIGHPYGHVDTESVYRFLDNCPKEFGMKESKDSDSYRIRGKYIGFVQGNNPSWIMTIETVHYNGDLYIAFDIKSNSPGVPYSKILDRFNQHFMVFPQYSVIDNDLEQPEEKAA